MSVPHQNLALQRGGFPTVWLDENFAALDASAGQPHDNLIWNGELSIWQQNGLSIPALAGANRYGPDLFLTSSIGSQIACSRGIAGLGGFPSEPKYFMGVIVNSVAGAGNLAYFQHRIESAQSFSDETLTLAFNANALADTPISIECLQTFGTGGAPSSPVSTFIAKPTITTSNAEYVFTFHVPSVNGKVIGNNSDDTFNIRFWLDAASNYDNLTQSLGQRSSTLNFWNFRMNYGSSIVAKNIRKPQQTLAFCQRYFYKTFYPDQAPTTGLGLDSGAFCMPQPVGASSGFDGAQIRFPTAMYKPPSLISYNIVSANAQMRNFSIGADCSGLAAVANVNSIRFTSTTPPGSAVGHCLAVHWTCDATMT